MQNKLQELTDKLYNEGLSKGKKEAEDLKAAAVKESDRIIADARKEAEKIVADARKEAEELRTRVENDIRMASSQTISSVRQRIENIIIAKAVSADTKKSLEDPDMIKSLLTTVAAAFNAASSRLHAGKPAGLVREERDGSHEQRHRRDFLQADTGRFQDRAERRRLHD